MKASRCGVWVVALVSLSASAQVSEAPSLWETVIKVEQYGPRDREPMRTQTRTKRQCLGATERDAEQLLREEDLAKRLKDKCWKADSRKEADRAQVKWTCKDGTTAEVATRTHSATAFGAMIVFNIPDQGAISMQAETKKIADTCPAEPPVK